MKILVIGGTGFISGRVVQKLLENDHHVTIFTRGRSPNPLPKHDHLEYLVGDRHDELNFKETLRHRTFDAVYDFIAYEPAASELAAKIFRAQVGRFIHCSTVSVYMVSEAIQCPISEDQDHTPLMPYWDRNPFGMDYGIQKRQCEQVLWQAHDELAFPVTVLRPTFVSGPFDPARRDFFWIERILDGQPLLVPGSGDLAFQSVFVDDVAQAFVSVLNCSAAIGQAYNVAAEEVFSLNDYLKWLGLFLNRNLELVHVDQAVFDRLPFSRSPNGDVFPFNTRRTAIFSLDKIKRDLNYCSTSFKKWLPVTIQWYLNNDHGHSNGYEKRREELKLIRRIKKINREANDGVEKLFL